MNVIEIDIDDDTKSFIITQPRPPQTDDMDVIANIILSELKPGDYKEIIYWDTAWIASGYWFDDNTNTITAVKQQLDIDPDRYALLLNSLPNNMAAEYSID